MTDEEFDYDDPCRVCAENGYVCDGWEMRFCCTKCRADGLEHCDDCDPMDI